MIFKILLPILALMSAAELLLYYTHMFQLNSYMAVRQMRWVRANTLFGLVYRIIIPIVIAVMLAFFHVGTSVFFDCAAAVLSVFQIILCFPGKAKKPLVFTNRAIRLLATQVIVSALVASLAETFVTHDRTSALFIVSALSFAVVLAAGAINLPIEKRIQQGFINKAKKKLESMPNLVVIGITGSYGKSSVKHCLAKILSSKYNILMTPGSYNTTMGVVRTINEMLTPAHEIFICEMGAKARGQIKEICDIVHPKYGILTSIGPQHLENFKSIENIIAAKFELIDALPHDGAGFVNFDNRYIRNHSVANVRTVKYGTTGDCDCFAENLCVTSTGTDFDVRFKNGDISLSTKLVGRHNVLNITGCVAVAKYLSLSDEEIKLPVKRLECTPHRLQVTPMGGEITLLDDAFNANPDGVKAALEVLSSFDAKKILITPGMIELGSVQHEENRRFGAEAARVCDKVFLVGNAVTASIREGLESENYPSDSIVSSAAFTDAFSAARALYPGEKKVILIENDLPDNYR